MEQRDKLELREMERSKLEAFDLVIKVLREHGRAWTIYLTGSTLLSRHCPSYSFASSTSSNKQRNPLGHERKNKALRQFLW